jgi:hypothetical protein
MSAKKKTIRINPNYLSLNRNTAKKGRRKSKRSLISSSLRPNNVKKQLMERIKKYQIKQKINSELPDPDTKSLNKFQDSFTKSMELLENVISTNKEKKKQKQRTKELAKQISKEQIPNPPTPNKQIPNNQPPTPIIHIHTPPLSAPIEPTPINTEQITPLNITPLSYQSNIETLNTKTPPPWGNLKNGRKPTYSQYRRSLENNDRTPSKQKPIIIETDNNNEIKDDIINIQRREKLMELKKKFNHIHNLNINDDDDKQKTKTDKRFVHILKRKFTLGKHNNRIGVLIKSRQRRKTLRKETLILKKRPINEVKQYLFNHNLIKKGSSAPERVMREIYETSFLTGDVFNKNPDNLIHNYLNN